MFDARSFLEGLYQPAPPDPWKADLGPDDLPGDWRVEFEERAAIMEFDGGLPRERAEALALAETVNRWRSLDAQDPRQTRQDSPGAARTAP
jgi:hypothetical protein